MCGTEQSQNRRLPITTAIMGMVSLSIFTSSSRPPIYIFTHNEFQWTPYEDPTIRAIIPDELFQNPNVWHVKVPLVNYATVEIYQLDRDPWQAIFIVERGEATTNSCPKGTTGPFKSKKKGRRRKPINNTHTIIRPNSSADDSHITAFSDYAKCAS
ncbi:hypothetical protein CXB51_014201 [Gossypium anomalum]|uniref:Uncharacterized protein n=1 Tax=Gossypium anomalum TaxID=47600 RepID=A0A8J6D087_9ROSI|nr:hypothetical protein CXB51_014201 [Gossypium anomalum]